MDRRDFLKKAGLGLGAVAVAAAVPASVKAMINHNEKTNKKMKKILIINGSPRKNGTTASLVNAFSEGARSVGNEVRELYLSSMNIRCCMACEACSHNGGTCSIQDDDMHLVNEGFEWADVVVFASPMFWGTLTGQLKTAIDRLYAEYCKLGHSNFNKQAVLLMTSRGGNAPDSYYHMALDSYHVFTELIGWPDLGTVLGAGKEAEARALGASIK